MAVALIAVLASGTASLADGPPLKRGGGIHNAMNWADTNAEKSGYLFPPFGRPPHGVPDERLAALKQAGFDFVRVTVDPGPFIFFEGAERDSVEADLVRFIRRVRANGLDVVIDFHPVGNARPFAATEFVKDVSSPLFVRYLDVLRRTAALLAKEDINHFAIELLNEPQTGWQSETRIRWQEQLKLMHDAVREESQDLVIILTGARGGSSQGLTELDPSPYRESNVRYSFHFYSPLEFTHQSYQGGLSRYLQGLPFPATLNDYDAFRELVDQRIQLNSELSPEQRTRLLWEAKTKLKDYFESRATPTLITQTFDEISAWARQNRIEGRHIFLGEFGVMRASFKGARDEDRQFWLKAVRDAAETRGFSWSVWSLDAQGMGIFEELGSATLQPNVLQALGLKGR